MGRLPLDGLTVFDVTRSVAANYCSKLMLELGARVSLVAVPATGDAGRVAERVVAGTALDEFLNEDKTSVRAEDAADLAALVTDALAAPPEATVVVLCDDDTASLAELLPRRSGLVVCTVREFDDAGPYARWHGGEIVHQALAGILELNGLPGRKPLFGFGQRMYFAAGTAAFVSCVSAFIGAARGAGTDRLEVIVHEVAAGLSENLATNYSFNGRERARLLDPPLVGLVRASDGWVVFYGLRHWPAVCALFGAPELATDPRFDAVEARKDHWWEALAVFRSRVTGMTVHELVRRGQENKVSIGAVESPRDLPGSGQLRDRGLFVSDGGRRRLALPFLSSAWGRGRLAPGAAGDDGPSGGAGAPGRQGAVMDADRAVLPLAGIRILDLTAAWSGPFATKILAMLGADVLKVESPVAIDSWRGGVQGTEPVNLPMPRGAGPDFDQHAGFCTQNVGKKSIALNLKDPAALALARRLVASSNLVISNFSSGVIERLGLGYDVVREIGPDTVQIEMPGYGRGGPMSHYMGMGLTMEASCGMNSLYGYTDDDVLTSGFPIMDPLGGLNGAAAAVTALLEQARGRGGQHIEVAQTECGIFWLGEHFAAIESQGTFVRAVGNDRPDRAPHDTFPCAGPDEWIAIAVADDAQWRGLLAVLGLDSLAGDPAFAGIEDRRRHRAELYESIASRTRTADKFRLAEQLQARGVPAAPVLGTAEVYRDAGLWAGRFYQWIEHPLAGTRVYPSLGLRLGGRPVVPSSPAPLFGADADSMLPRWLGDDAVDVPALIHDGTVRLYPDGAPAPAGSDTAAPTRRGDLAMATTVTDRHDER